MENSRSMILILIGTTRFNRHSVGNWVPLENQSQTIWTDCRNIQKLAYLVNCSHTTWYRFKMMYVLLENCKQRLPVSMYFFAWIWIQTKNAFSTGRWPPKNPSGNRYGYKKQDEAHEPECRHVCWQTETVLICHISSKLTCETPWVHTLRWHSCRTPLLDIIAKRSGETLLLDTLVRHSCKTLLTWHSCKTLSLDTLLGHSCLTLLPDTLVRHSYMTLLLDALTWHFLLDTLLRHSCKTLLLDTLVGHSYLTLL